MLSPDVTWCVEGAWETPGTGPASSGSLQGSIPGLPTSPVTPSAEPSSSPWTKDPYPLQPRTPLQHSQGYTCPTRGPLPPTTEGPGHGPQRAASRNHHADCHWHVPGPLGSSRDDRAVLLESGWRIWKNMSQNKPREVQGSSSFLQWP